MAEPKAGLRGRSEMIVAEQDTAASAGSGDMPVLSTPRMVALMENAAMKAVSSSLAEGETTVGGGLDIKHLYPSKVGARVSAEALLSAVDGRKLTFEVEVYDSERLVGKGFHVRFIVEREPFLTKLR